MTEPKVFATLEELHSYVAKATGWGDKLKSSCAGGVIRLETDSSILLVYNVRTFQEIYGRLGHMCLSPADQFTFARAA